MFGKHGAAMVASFFLVSITAAVYADTLATWKLSDKLNSYASVDADSSSLSTALESAQITRKVASAASSNAGFGGNAPEKKGTSAEYMAVTFIVSSTHTLAPSTLNFYLYHGSSGPSPYWWTAWVDDENAPRFTSDQVTFSATEDDSPYKGSLDISSLGTLPAGTKLTLVLSATSNTKGRHLSFCNTMTLEGTAEEYVPEELTLHEIEDVEVNYGETVQTTLSVLGNGDNEVSYSYSNNAGALGNVVIENGIFTYTPALADVEHSPIEFTVTATAGEDSDSKSFVVTVNPPSVTPREGVAIDCYIGDEATDVNFDFIGNVEGCTTNGTWIGTPPQGIYSFKDGVLTFTPDAADDDQTFTFRVTLTVEEQAFTGEVAISVSMHPKTLVTWNINSHAAADTKYGVTYESPTPIAAESAALELGEGVDAGNRSNTFGGSGFITSGASFADAWNEKQYIAVLFRAAENYNIKPKQLIYNIYRSGTGPSKAQWVRMTGDNTYETIGEELTFSSETAANQVLTLSGIGTLGKGESVELRLVAWGATRSSGTFYFNSPSMVLSGIAIEDKEQYVEPTLTIGGTENSLCYVGDTFRATLLTAGTTGSWVTESSLLATCKTAGVATSSYSIDNGIFTYSPTATDVAQGVVTFEIKLTVLSTTPGHEREESIVEVNVSVWDKPEFFETFENKKKTSWGNDEPVSTECVEGYWRGTNYLVATPHAAWGNGHLRFQKTAGYLEMEGQKNTGASFVALTYGFYSTKGQATIRLLMQQKAGTIWGDWEEVGRVIFDETIDINKREKITLGDPLEGFVRLRIECETTQNICIDDIAIGDYGEPAEEPIEDLTVLPLIPGQMLREDFDSFTDAATQSLPRGWRVAATNEMGNTDLHWADGGCLTGYRGGLEMSSNANAGIYNITNNGDNALGFLSSGTKAKTCALMVHLENQGTMPIKTFNLKYSVEQWRRGRGRQIALYISLDGVTWTAAGAPFVTQTVDEFEMVNNKEAATGYTAQDLPESIPVSGKLSISENLNVGDSLYLAWFYTKLPDVSDDGSKAQVLAIDDIEIRCGKFTLVIFK